MDGRMADGWTIDRQMDILMAYAYLYLTLFVFQNCQDLGQYLGQHLSQDLGQDLGQGLGSFEIQVK